MCFLLEFLLIIKLILSDRLNLELVILLNRFIWYVIYYWFF